MPDPTSATARSEGPISKTDSRSSANDRRVLRELAARWAEVAAQPVMETRKRQWRALHDLRPERPMILIETSPIRGFVDPGEMRCTNPILRAAEANLRDTIRHAEEVGDDVVVEPYFRIAWDVSPSSFGVDVTESTTAQSRTFSFPIRDPRDINRLLPRVFGVDRATTIRRRHLLEDAFGDVLPVRVGNYDHFVVDKGNEIWAGSYFFGLTQQIYKFIGNEGLLYWLYDAPETIHWLMEYMTQDRERTFDLLESEGLAVPNTDNQMAGPRAYGYVSDLPDPDTASPTCLKDLWCWAEAQETSSISPTMFQEFFLPYIARLSARFGLVYYGCCEPVHDRLEPIMQAIPNLRSVSVSPWADVAAVAEMLGRRYVYSRKPHPAFVSGANPDWDQVENDLRATRAATRDCNVELLLRTVLEIDGDRPRLARWVAMAKSIFDM